MPGFLKGTGHFFGLRTADKKSANRTGVEHSLGTNHFTEDWKKKSEGVPCPAILFSPAATPSASKKHIVCGFLIR